jgi:hypothetical protein
MGVQIASRPGCEAHLWRRASSLSVQSRGEGASVSAFPERLSASDARGATAADLLLTSGLVVVEQAKAALSALFGVTPDEALHLLQGLARSQHRPLHEFAAEVLRNAGRLDGDLVGDAVRVL